MGPRKGPGHPRPHRSRLSRVSAIAGTKEGEPSGTGEEPKPTGDATGGLGGIARHAVVYGAGIIAGKGMAFLMLPIYTRFLSPADYGVMALISMTLDVISIFAGAQLAHGIFRFYHKAETDRERNAVVSTAFVSVVVGFGAVAMLVVGLAPFLSSLLFGSGEHVTLIRVAAAGLFTQSLVGVPFAYARVRDRSGLFVGVGFFSAMLGAAFNVFFLAVMGLGVLSIFLSATIANTVVGVGMSAWVLRQVGFGFDQRAVRDLLRYGLPLVAMQVATFIATFSDRYFLQALGDEAAVGLYNLAYQFGFLLVTLAFIPIETVWGPRRFAVAQHPDRDRIFAESFVLLNIPLLGLALAFSLYIGDVLRVMTTPAFHEASALVHLILVAYVLQAWAGMQDIGILVKERTEFLTLANWVSAGVALVSLWFLVPRYLGMGAAAAAVVALGTRWALTYLLSQRLWRISYRWGPVLRLSTAALVLATLGGLLPPLPLLASLAVRLPLLGLFALFVWFGGVLLPEERDRLRALVRSGVRLVRGLRGGPEGGGAARAPR